SESDEKRQGLIGEAAELDALGADEREEECEDAGGSRQGAGGRGTREEPTPTRRRLSLTSFACPSLRHRRGAPSPSSRPSCRGPSAPRHGRRAPGEPWAHCRRRGTPL